MRKTVRVKKKNVTKGGMFKKSKSEKSFNDTHDKTINFIVHHNKECRRFIYLLKSIILITQRTRKSYRNTIHIMSGKEMYNHIKTSPIFNKIYSSMNPEQKESYNEYMELFLNMGHTILVGDYSFEKLKKINAYTMIRNKQIYTDFLNYKKEVENLSMSDKTILNKIPPDESYYIPGDKDKSDKSKKDIYGNESLTMKQKFEVLNIKFDPSSESSELIHSDNPLIKSANSESNSESKENKNSKNNVDKNTSAKGNSPVNKTRKASYNKNSKSYVCGETNFELILPPTHKPSSPVIGKKNMIYYEIPIPPATKPGSRIKFKQSPPPIPNIDHNAGKNPPDCPLKQRLNIVNHLPNEKSNTNRNRKHGDLDRKTAKFKLSSVIPRLKFSSERMATSANYYRNGTTPFTSGPHGPARETWTPQRFQEQLWRNGLSGKNPTNRFGEFPKIEFPKFPTW